MHTRVRTLVYRRMYGHVCRRVYGHVCRSVYGHVCRRVQRHGRQSMSGMRPIVKGACRHVYIDGAAHSSPIMNKAVVCCIATQQGVVCRIGVQQGIVCRIAVQQQVVLALGDEGLLQPVLQCRLGVRHGTPIEI